MTGTEPLGRLAASGLLNLRDLGGTPTTDGRMVQFRRLWRSENQTGLSASALQSLIDTEEQAELAGLSDADWRERIGNAVPPDAAQAIAETMGRTLLLAWSGEGFMLSALPIWVRPMAVALSVRQPQDAA